MTIRGWLWRGSSPWMFFLELLVIGLHLVFFAALARKALLPPPVTPEIRLLSEASAIKIERRDHFRLNLLCLGLDSVEGSHRTDTILLLGIDFSTRGIHILSIPRDTRVVIDGHQRKINEVYTRHGVEVLQTLIEELLEIRINRYIKVDFQGFVKVIDLIGGIDLLIERPMHYDDNWGKLHIHFDPGWQHLNGKKALEYVRYRGDASADLGRVKRQQRFIAAVLEKVMAPSFLLKIPDLLHEVFAYIDTNLTLPETIELAMGMRGKGFATQSDSLPGEARYIDKISFYVPFKEQAMAIGTKYYSALTSFELNAPFQASGTAAAAPSSTGTPSLPMASSARSPVDAVVTPALAATGTAVLASDTRFVGSAFVASVTSVTFASSAPELPSGSETRRIVASATNPEIAAPTVASSSAENLLAAETLATATISAATFATATIPAASFTSPAPFLASPSFPASGPGTP
jgi:LCP family protein required for cell wall assembly